MSVIHRGFCVKSPPKAYSRWKRRWCTLMVADDDNIAEVYKQRDDAFQNKELIARPDLHIVVKYLVFSYYIDEESEKSGNPIKQFIMDDAVVSNKPGGEHGFKFAIKIHLSSNYNSRILFLCFDEKEEHERWLAVFTKYFEEWHRRCCSINIKPVESEVYKPCENNPLQNKIHDYRRQVTREREEKKRLSEMSQEVSSSEYDEIAEEQTPTQQPEVCEQVTCDVSSDKNTEVA